MRFDNSYSRLPGEFFSRVTPTSLESPFLISWNRQLADQLGMESPDPDQAATWFGKMEPLPGSDPIAAVYAGHQFGHYVPQLGDGRSILLGEMVTKEGERWDLHLKGSGQTPYSRDGDGRAVLRSSIREYLCSEAMGALGIPTTRGLTLIGSEEEVYRESIERGATLLRLAPSHIRFGTFEYFYYRQQTGSLWQLLDYLQEYHFPELLEFPREQQALELFRQVSIRTATLIAQWQLVGFAHGVMNTDNMSILGLTIDYGPFGFLDRYEPELICNHSDHDGRYAFNRQPQIAQWNLSCLAQALLPLVGGDDEKGLEQASRQLIEIVEQFQDLYQCEYDRGLSRKLGIERFEERDRPLHQQWLGLLERNGMDYTRSFRLLAEAQEGCEEGACRLQKEVLEQQPLSRWLEQYYHRLGEEGTTPAQRRVEMNRVNPKYILRNYLAQQAIERAESGDYREVEQLLALLQNPFDEQPEREHYAQLPPAWAAEISVSCSS